MSEEDPESLEFYLEVVKIPKRNYTVICEYCLDKLNVTTYVTQNCEGKKENKFRRHRKQCHGGKKFQLEFIKGCPRCCKCDNCKIRIEEYEQRIYIENVNLYYYLLYVLI